MSNVYIKHAILISARGPRLDLDKTRDRTDKTTEGSRTISIPKQNYTFVLARPGIAVDSFCPNIIFSWSPSITQNHRPDGRFFSSVNKPWVESQG
jgi:hypothetical protein